MRSLLPHLLAASGSHFVYVYIYITIYIYVHVVRVVRGCCGYHGTRWLCWQDGTYERPSSLPQDSSVCKQMLSMHS